MKTLIKKLYYIFYYNKSMGVIYLVRKLINKIYNIMFLKKYNIVSDYSSYIYGITYMEIGSLSLGRYCRIEMIVKYNGYKLNPLLKVGNRVCFNDMVHIGCANYIEIGDDCLFASRIYISDHNHGIYKGLTQSHVDERIADRDLTNDKTVIIGKNVWLGEGVAVLPGAHIGDNSIIATNAVVVGEIPSDCIAAGIPAKVVKRFNRITNLWENK